MGSIIAFCLLAFGFGAFSGVGVSYIAGALNLTGKDQTIKVLKNQLKEKELKNKNLNEEIGFVNARESFLNDRIKQLISERDEYEKIASSHIIEYTEEQEVEEKQTLKYTGSPATILSEFANDMKQKFYGATISADVRFLYSENLNPL